MSSRALVVYAVSDPQGGTTHPTLRAALRDARARVAHYRTTDPDNCQYIEVQRVTIPGPLNRELVCRLLSIGGYASEVVTVWKARQPAARSGEERLTL